MKKIKENMKSYLKSLKDPLIRRNAISVMKIPKLHSKDKKNNKKRSCFSRLDLSDNALLSPQLSNSHLYKGVYSPIIESKPTSFNEEYVSMIFPSNLSHLFIIFQKVILPNTIEQLQIWILEVRFKAKKSRIRNFTKIWRRIKS